ncbi:multidrug and toxin extrusion protein 2 [Carettochelys insculpta]|uniref:multidrug and toxin extrusion protein 2 n=1 Tax=Carettochelys insculpta TaxID=44489 RepID=UPI003EBC8A4F
MELAGTMDKNPFRDGRDIVPQAPSSSSRQKSSRWLCQLIPFNFWEEAKNLLVLGWPLVLIQLLVFMTHVVSAVFCSHLGKVELASVTLAVTVINCSGISVGYGLSEACDTLISQTYGSKNMKRVGLILQRGILILLLCCFPCWALFINTERILLLIQQDPEVSRLSQVYVMIFVPALPAVFLYQLEIRYLYNQKIIWPQVASGIAGNIINAIANYVFLHLLDLSVTGSACANTIAQYTQTICLLFYIVMKKLHVKTWEGWSSECLQEWDTFVSLAVPSMLMVCIEWWTYEIGNFLVGLLSLVDLSTQAIIYQVSMILYMIPNGLSNAVCIRVGNALGAGNADEAKRSFTIGMLCTGLFCLVTCIILAATKDVLGYIFTSDLNIIALVGEVMPLYVVVHLLECSTCVTSKVLRGAGKQKVGAILNALSYYGVGLPVAVVLLFVARIGVKGLWLGFLFSGFVSASSTVFYLVRLNWKRASEEARHRAGVNQLAGEETNSAPVPHKLVLPTGEAEAQNRVILTSITKEGQTYQLPQQEATPALSTIGEMLSGKQLIIRRGLAVMVAIATLVAGILVKVLTVHH